MKCPHCKKKISKTGAAHRANLKQWKFAVAYVKNGGNATRAAQEAGYTGNDVTLAQTGSRLLKNVKVLEVVERWTRPLDDISEDAIREVMTDANDGHARIKAAQLDARIRGKLAMTRSEHRHLHIHATAPLPQPTTADGVEAIKRAIRVLIAKLPNSERAGFLEGPALVIDVVPALPELANALGDRRDAQQGGQPGAREG